MTRDVTLDEAWAEAEAALPEGWRLNSVKRNYAGQRWSATAVQGGLTKQDRMHTTVPICDATGPTPTAALQALAEKLRAMTPPTASERSVAAIRR